MEPIVVVVAGDAAPFSKKTASWHAKDGRSGTLAYDSKRYAGWKDAARYAASQVMGERAPLAVAVSLHIKVFRQIPSGFSAKKRQQAEKGALRPTVTPDWDNLAKACGDALVGIVLRDDKFVADGRVEKFFSDRPRVEMTICELEETPVELPKPDAQKGLFA
ncbi:MAG TPA: RusA family crossover junction endodeoxyribonuclease [Dongiaceae bacterium]|nr:RusA family crossover junction endodeoxyribonuclease [Dongiaceae bacterium]